MSEASTSSPTSTIPSASPSASECCSPVVAAPQHRIVRKSSGVVRIGIGAGDRGRNAATTERTRRRAVDEWMARGFRALGHRMADWRVPTIAVVLVFSALCSARIPFTPQQDDLKSGYTPRGARSREELVRYERFFAASDDVDVVENGNAIVEEKDPSDPVSVAVFVTARDGGNLLRERLLNETVALIDTLTRNFTLADRGPFAQFCTDFCMLNEPVRQFANGFLAQHLSHGNGDHMNDDDMARVNLSYPFMHILGRQIDLSPHLFGVELYPDDGRRQVSFVRLIVLQLRAKRQPNVSRAEMARWERSIVDYLHRDYHGELRPLAFTMTLVADEVVRTGMTLFPYLSVGFATICVFSVATVYLSAFYFDQWSVHKMLMALVACVCPLLACSSALGLLFWLGVRFGSILCVSPFLVMAIGVDDAFLMIQCWQRIALERARIRRALSASASGRQDTLRERVGDMLVDVGPSITITSATNVLAFCIGTFTPTPEIQLFCAGTAVAICFDYIYQLVLFTPCLALAGESEMLRESSQNAKSQTQTTLISGRIRNAFREVLSRFMRSYCRWLSSGFTALAILCLLIAYWICSAQNALKIVPNITPRKLFLADSLVNQVNELRDSFVLPSYLPVSIFVDRPGDLRNATTRRRVETLISEFEQQPNSLGPEFTHFWLRDYERYSAEFDEEETDNTFTRDQMNAFLNWPEYRHWNGFVHFEPENGTLDRFFVITGFRGPELVDWGSRAKQLAHWRAIADKYADLGAFVWMEEAQFLDQIDTLVPATIQSSIATLLCMMLVCSVFMANLFTVILATLSIVSICVGTFGLLALWGIDLDPISMATTIMSIGFSVDFPAHLTYHYYRCGHVPSRPEERVQRALVAIGFPLLQCGLSTILFVLSLLFVDTYMSEVFVKTMFLVVALGLLHGLLVVPCMLCALSNAHTCWHRANRDKEFGLSTLFELCRPRKMSCAANSIEKKDEVPRGVAGAA